MEYLVILEKIWLILATPSIAVIGYQQYRINKLNERVDQMLSKEEAHMLVQDKADALKEKIEDVVTPINTRLDRVDTVLDKISDKLDRLFLDH